MTKRRKRRAFTPEFKADAVKLVLAGARTVGQVAKDLDLTETALRAWVRQAEVDAGQGTPETLATDERNELAHLRRENKQLRMEREILKAAALFQDFALHLEPLHTLAQLAGTSLAEHV